MKKRTNPFHKRNTPAPPEEPQPASAMTDEELDESLQKARKDLLDIRHEELRIRERARLAPGDASGSSPSRRRPLSEVFSKSKRRFK